HVILRGGTDGPNYGVDAVADAAAKLTGAGLPARVVIDCSHANSGKDHVRQASVAAEVAQLVRDGLPISGVMLESFLVAGAQAPEARPLTYGQSVTDKCMDWDATDLVLRELAGRDG
nr:3-deoxy-7-phosphoheptulonate synthase [Streptomyces sp. DSM 41633]